MPLVRLVAAASKNALNSEGAAAALSTSERFVEPLMFEGELVVKSFKSSAGFLCSSLSPEALLI